MPPNRPRSNLQNPAPARTLLLWAAAALGGVVVLALSARANEPEARRPDLAAELEAAATAVGDGGMAEEETAASENGAENAIDFSQIARLPSFEDLAPLPREQDLLARAERHGDRLVVQSGAEPRALTIDPVLQKRLTDLLRSYAVPYGAVAAIEPSTGRVLALAEHSKDAPEIRGLPLRAIYPAASIFKVVTGAALLAEGVKPDESVCYHGGKRRLHEKLLKDDPRRDRACADLGAAMARSTNVVFAKLAARKLDQQKLKGWAERLGFNAPIAFAQPTDVSLARIPAEEFGLARTAAGFGEVFLSPLHGALLAGAVANKGVWTEPVLFDGEPVKSRRVLDESAAEALANMMEATVTQGTARRAFRERGRYALRDVRAAGKTGSIFDRDPFRDFTWFVGWAPLENPKIAVATVVVNGDKWRVHAPYVAREALRMYLQPERAEAPRKARKQLAAAGTRRSRPH